MRLYLVAALLLGCGKVEIRPDPSLATTLANYPTSEVYACGRTWLGLASCVVDKDSEQELVFETFGKGTLTVTYADGAPDVRTYNNEVITITHKVVSTEIVRVRILPDIEDSPEKIESMWGAVLFRVRNGDTQATNEKVRQGSLKHIPVEIEDGVYPYTAKGCGQDLAGHVVAKNSRAEIQVDAKGPTDTVCTISGTVGSVRYSHMVAHYDESFVPLAIPSLKFTGMQLKVTADNTVSVIALDSKYEFKNSAQFQFEKKKPHKLRLVTIKGRAVLGIWDTKSWQWLQ